MGAGQSSDGPRSDKALADRPSRDGDENQPWWICTCGSSASTLTLYIDRGEKAIGSEHPERELYKCPIDDKPDIPRTACPDGTRCKLRNKFDHLLEQAHPFDPDYIDACRECGMEAEEASLRGLFRWTDYDDSNKVSQAELEAALPLISRLFGEDFVLSPEAWERLDEDGNGHVNFSEFAEWAGPRLGLPLGVKHLFEGKSGRLSGRLSENQVLDSACGILGCPCEAFTPATKKTPSGQNATSSLRAEKRRKSWKDIAFVATGRGKDRLLMCRCGHKHSAHAERLPAPGEIPYPHYWSSDPSEEFIEFIPVSEASLHIFQELFSDTYLKIWTRDRRKHNKAQPNVPESYDVVKAWRCENSKIWREYCTHRAMLCKDRDEAPADDNFVEYADVKSTLAWSKHAGVSADRLFPECNEWYLFHGTNPTAARSICEHDFKINLAGGNTGTLYGRGSYLAESITKADEYAKPNEDGEYAVLLCRALGGRVKYTDEIQPNPEELVRCCIEGPYDCILGDREKCRGTYREFVFYDTENLYAEYIIHYKRKLAAAVPAPRK
mmetsp:Transcript_30771/g.56845  ORF Transcript_30771/g.56845 Transcript_30771/m.56845 type:complete len:553 (+) Transcript_30771:158-1816(+)